MRYALTDVRRLCKLSRLELGVSHRMRRDIKSLLFLLASTLLVTSGCASRNRAASLPPPAPASSAAEAETAGAAGIDGPLRAAPELAAGAEPDSGQAIAALERYLDRARDSNGELMSDLEGLRVRLDSLRALAVDGRSGIDGPTEVILRPEVEGLPLSDHSSVISKLEYFTQGPGRSTIEVGLERIGLYEPMFRRILAEEGVPEGLMYLAQAESTFKPEAVSSSAARGMWQFMAPRGEEYGLRQNWWIDERSDPEKSTRAAARHLRDLFGEFGDWYLAMAAYNAGPARIESAIRETGTADYWELVDAGQMSSQAREYVPTILAMAIIGSDPAAWGFDIAPEPSLDTIRVPLAEATDLRIIAGQLELPLEELQRLNPHVLRWATPPEDTEFELILPVGYDTLFDARIRPLTEDQRILFRYHEVEAGETLSHIARRYDVPIAAIVDSNGLANPDAIRIGQSLAIPVSGAAPSPDAPVVVPVAGARSGRAEDLPVGTDEAIIYNVRPGDTLTRIAAVFGTSVQELLESNRGSDLSVIHPGDEITIPGRGRNGIE
jgi:peptidoglycan lytic transglycosylase D